MPNRFEEPEWLSYRRTHYAETVALIGRSEDGRAMTLKTDHVDLSAHCRPNNVWAFYRPQLEGGEKIEHAYEHTDPGMIEHEMVFYADRLAWESEQRVRAFNNSVPETIEPTPSR